MEDEIVQEKFIEVTKIILKNFNQFSLKNGIGNIALNYVRLNFKHSNAKLIRIINKIVRVFEKLGFDEIDISEILNFYKAMLLIQPEK